MTDETQDKPVVGDTRNTERLDRMAEIASRAEQERAEDMDLASLDEAAPVVEEVAEAETATEQEQTELEVATEATEEAAPVKKKIKVNGKEIELTEEEIIGRAQKVEAADQYLAEAAKIYKAYKEFQPPDEGAEKVEDDDLALARALQNGTQEEVAQAIKKLRAPPAINADELPKLVDDRLTFLQAAERFQEEYQDILGDPILSRLAISEDQRLASEGDSRTYWERYQAIGNELRAWRGNLTKTTQLTAKRERKASVQSLPTASARASVPADNEPNDDPQTVIAQMAKRRGQAT